MSLHHTWTNNGLENKPDNNQQQLSPNQGSNFNVAPQQYQQNVASQQYQSQSAPMAQQYSQQPNLMQQPPQSVAPQQYSQQQQAGVAPQQYQQNVASQQYQSQSAPMAQQYSQQQNLMQQPPQSVAPQQYSQQQQAGVAPQQYQQNVAPQQYQPQSAPMAQQYQQQQQQSALNTGAQQYQPQQQYQQPMMQQQRTNFSPTAQQNPQGVNPMVNNVQQPSAVPTQNQTLAERIANLQSGGLNQNENYSGQRNIKPSDLLNVPIDPNIKVGLGKNMNIAAALPTDLFESETEKGNHKKNRKLNAEVEIDGLQCQCKNCVKKSRPWLTVLVSVLIMLAILGGAVGAIYGFRVQIKDWLLGTELTVANSSPIVSKSAGALLPNDKSISPTSYYLNS
ncbi:hypothetical protein S100390_v1c02940 [Spiroplasma sp. NBRC 100390]|nr:hypothetical protein STU14_v1c02940 [Spiroplasma sp. TU-14]APE13107.1 hypothetical protein S100390_v1c02940 [Spiroplasma sp. NBRC 100390]